MVDLRRVTCRWAFRITVERKDVAKVPVVKVDDQLDWSEAVRASCTEEVILEEIQCKSYCKK
jgi:hypothetical protein